MVEKQDTTDSGLDESDIDVGDLKDDEKDKQLDFVDHRSTLFEWARDIFIGVTVVVVIFGMLVLATGMFPPMVAVESGSMEDEISVGDMMVLTSPDMYQDSDADEYGVVTHEVGKEEGVTQYGDYGSVIVFSDPTASDDRIIHRAMFSVEEGEDWFDRGEEEYLEGAENCDELENCPAPHDGYVTKGDNNDYYDQAIGLASPIGGDWVVANAEYRIPGLGWLRLVFESVAL